MSTYEDEGFNYHKDAEDPDGDPESDLAGAGSRPDKERADGTRRTSRRNANRSNPTSTAKWLAKLAGLTNKELASPRVKAITNTVLQIHSENPTERIVVASGSVLFLEVTNEALTRLQQDVHGELTSIEFNGSIKSMDERYKRAQLFNRPVGEPGPKVMLPSALAGGTGLNLHGGSRVITCEPF